METPADLIGGRFVRLANIGLNTAILPRLAAPRHPQSPFQRGRVEP